MHSSTKSALRPTEAEANPSTDKAIPAPESPDAAIGQARELLGGVQMARGPARPAADVQAIAAEGVSGGGSTLPHLDTIQASFGGHDVSGVDAHVGGSAGQAAKAIGAEAYATGNSVAFANSPDLHTAAHEAAHVVQQRAGVQLKGGVGEVGDVYEQQADAVADLVVAGESAEAALGPVTGGSASAVQRQAVQRKNTAEQIVDLMSYDTWDWAITDDEATSALRMIEAQSPKGRKATVKKVGTKYINRLIDNLPDSARQTSAFANLLIAIGPTAVKKHITDMLSYGLFDWVITDGEASEVVRMIATLPAADQKKVAAALSNKSLSRLAHNLPQSAVIGQDRYDVLRRLFDATPAGEVDTLMKWLGLRFNITVKVHKKAKWDKTALRRSWDVMKMLPAAHVAANPDLSTYSKYDSKSIEGWASDSGEAAMGYGKQNLDTTNESGAFTNVGDPLYGKNLWDATVRHEVGHRVDPQVNASDGYCATADGGNWAHWSSGSGMAERMVKASNGAINTWSDAKQKKQIIDALQALIDARTVTRGNVNAKLKALPFLSKLATDAKQKALWKSIQGDDVYKAFPRILADSAPWMRKPTVSLGGKTFHEAYKGSTWVRYDVSARARQVSNYQFRAPGEWFAEVYAAYYDPAGATKGALLQARDPKTRTWMNDNVDDQGGKGDVDPTKKVG